MQIISGLFAIVKGLPLNQTIAKTYRLITGVEKQQSYSYLNRKTEKYCLDSEVIKFEKPCPAMSFRKQKRTPAFDQSKRPNM